VGKTAVVFSQKYYQHNTGKGHPESAKRLGAIVNELKRGKLSRSKNWQFVAPSKARIEDVELIHDIEYVRFVENFCRSGGGFLDSEDTVVSSESFDVALYAVGGTLKAVNLVMKGLFKNAFALVRPPGHHAEKFYAFGFCIFNNVAIAAKHLTSKFGLKRVLILDIDAHHGNGTQRTFYNSDKVLYISLHQDPRAFPGTGLVDEIGTGRGLSYNVNVPLPFQTTDRVYLKAVKEIVAPIACQYKPQFILVSAGLDCHYADSIADMSLSVLGYQRIYDIIGKLASNTCKGRLVSVLEGGYSTRFIGKIAATIIAKKCGAAFSVNDESPMPNKNIENKGEKIIKKVKEAHRAFWNLK